MSTRRMFGASGGAFTSGVKAASDPSKVRFAMPWNGWTGRGSTVLSHSESAATDPAICVVNANAAMIRHNIRLGITVLVTLCYRRSGHHLFGDLSGGGDFG